MEASPAGQQFPLRFVLFFLLTQHNFSSTVKTRKRVLGFLWFKGEWVGDTLEGPKGLVSTAFKNGGRCRVVKLEPLCCLPPISSYMASQSLTTFKNNYLMRWVNVRLFLSAPQHQTALCNSFYSLRTPLGGATSTLVLHPLDLIKIRFQGKILGITWLRVNVQMYCNVKCNAICNCNKLWRECGNHSMK